jgi:Cu/Ag efflux pump CusA
MLDIPTGGLVPLNEVADVLIVPVPNQITREFASRYTEVTCNVKGRDLSKVAGDIQSRLENVPFDRGYHPELPGEYAAQQEAKNRILALSLLVLIGIFIILLSDFGSARLAFLIFSGLPFALTGGVISAILSGGVLSLGSLIGFITVLGIAARNSIMPVIYWKFGQVSVQEKN